MNINMSQTDVTGLHNIIIKCVYYTVYQINTNPQKALMQEVELPLLI